MSILFTVSAGAYYIFNDSLTPGELVTFIFYVNNFMNLIRRLVNFNEQFQKGMVGFNKFLELLDVASEADEKENAVKLFKVKGKIKYENVTFGYDNHKKVSQYILILRILRISNWSY